MIQNAAKINIAMLLHAWEGHMGKPGHNCNLAGTIAQRSQYIEEVIYDRYRRICHCAFVVSGECWQVHK